MHVTRTVLTERQLKLIDSIDKKMDQAQEDLNELDKEMQAALEVVNEIKVRIREAKRVISPFAEMKASVSNVMSRNKYFPEFLGRFDNPEKTEAFYEYLEDKLEV